MTERHISHNDNTRQKEVQAVQGEHSVLAQTQKSGGDVQALHGQDLKVTAQQWEDQFKALPRVQGSDKIDTSKFGKQDWDNLHTMFTEMNKPGGAIETARATQQACEKACTSAQGNLHYSDKQPPHRSRG
jgi:hypothetical protein